MDSEGSIEPILVHFENGTLNPMKQKDVKFACYRSVSGAKKVLMADTGSLIYSGVKQKAASTVKYYLGVVDRKSGKIERVNECSIFSLHPKLQDQKLSNKDTDDTAKTFSQKNDALIEAFGSSKQKRLISSRKKNQTAKESIVEKVADVAMKMDFSKSPSSTPTSPEQESNIAPPANSEAKTAHDVYSINDVIPMADYVNEIRPHATDLINCNTQTLASWRNQKTYPIFILDLLSRMPLSQSERVTRSCQICYLEHLMKLYSLTFKDIRKKDPCPTIPDPIKSNLLHHFTYFEESTKQRRMSKKDKDRILCYILVLSLIIEEYEMDCSFLMTDLKLGGGLITKMLRSIGCSVKTQGRKRNITGDPSMPTIIATLLPPIAIKSTDDKAKINDTELAHSQIKKESGDQKEPKTPKKKKLVKTEDL